MSLTTQTRDQVVAELIAASSGGSPALTPNVTPLAVYDYMFKLESLATPRIVVVPQAKRAEPLTRASARHREVVLDVAVQYRYATVPPSANEIDPYLSLAEAIVDHFERRQLDNKAVCTKAEHTRLFVEKHLEEFGVFTSVVSLTFTLNQ